MKKQGRGRGSVSSAKRDLAFVSRVGVQVAKPVDPMKPRRELHPGRKSHMKVVADERARVVRREAATRLIPTLVRKEDEHLGFAIADVLDQSLWMAPPLPGRRWHYSALLPELVGVIELETSSPYIHRRVSKKELKMFLTQVRRLASTLRNLPGDVQSALAYYGELVGDEERSDLEADFLPKLDRLAAEASRWARGERRQSKGSSSQGAKERLEDKIAYTLAAYGVPLSRHREGTLAKILRIGYSQAGVRAGKDSFRALRRLSQKWTPEAVSGRSARLTQLTEELEASRRQRAQAKSTGR